ncbi:SMI1/KNR4 family protein [Pedobacter frigoris]|uniref:SMI1/KNR4 family protein n=1 Tax=Pedobacter frigoris TaxID=2571272 RepID=UPI00292D4923|nr:SMI1/KNR4 family protein [Pedobacter frigoris]
MRTLVDILERYNWPVRSVEASTPAKDIEFLVGFRMPADYAFFLNNYIGGESHIGAEYVKLWDIDELIELNTAYGIYTLSNTLGIGSNAGGEFLAIEMTGSQEHRIVLSPFIDLDKSYHIEVGTSFTDFLVRLDSGKQFFSAL